MEIIELIPLSMLNAFVYCPRRFYYEFVEGLMLTNEHVEEGRIAHKTVEESESKKTVRGDTVQSRSLYLSSESYGIAGKIDLVEEQGYKVRPIEYKKKKIAKNNDQQPVVYKNDTVQLCAEALLLEDNGFGEIEDGYIYFVGSKKRVRVEFDEELRNDTLKFVESARQQAKSDQIPPSLEDDPRCIACSLLPLCMPEETTFLARGTSEAVSQRPIIPVKHDEGVLYVQEQGSIVQKRGKALVVRSRQGELVEEIPLIHIRQLVIFGHVQLSTQAMAALLEASIPVNILSIHGRFKGTLSGIPSKNSSLRRAQYEWARDPERCLSLARSFVKAKVHNQRVLLMRYARGKTAVEDIMQETQALDVETASCIFGEAVNQIKNIENAIDTATGLNTLLGIEGNAARLYFGLFGELLNRGRNSKTPDPESKSEPLRQWFSFEGRNRRPPRDPVNALLSLAYSLLLKDCLSSCMIVGFDPYIGFFHQDKYGRPALALDIMEEFRPLVADSVVLTLLNNRMLQEDDFFWTRGACYLKENGRKKFFEAYEARMNTLVTHPIFGYRISYSRVIETQVRLLARVVEGEIPNYIGFQVR